MNSPARNAINSRAPHPDRHQVHPRAAVMVKPHECWLAQQPDDIADPLIIVLQIALEDRLVVGDPVPQCPKAVERQVKSLAIPYVSRKDPVEIGTPDRRVVGIGEQRHPESEGKFRDDAVGSWLLADSAETLNCSLHRAYLGWPKHPCGVEPTSAVGCAHHTMDRVAKSDDPHCATVLLSCTPPSASPRSAG